MDRLRQPVNPLSYRHRAGLPLIIPAWGLVKTYVYFDEADAKEVRWVRFRDMHEKEIDVRVHVSSVPGKWSKPNGPYDLPEDENG